LKLVNAVLKLQLPPVFLTSRSLKATVSRSKAKALLMVSNPNRNAVCMSHKFFTTLLDVSMAIYVDHIQAAIYLWPKHCEGFPESFCLYNQILKFCESEQCSFLDEVASEPNTMLLAEEVVNEVFVHIFEATVVMSVIFLKFKFSQ
jgi:hypothetical protein